MLRLHPWTYVSHSHIPCHLVFRPFWPFGKGQATANTLRWLLRRSPGRAPHPKRVEITSRAHWPDTQIGLLPDTFQLHKYAGWGIFLDYCENITLRRHEISTSAILRLGNGFINQVQSVLKYSWKPQLEYKLPFLDAGKSDITCDMKLWISTWNTIISTCCHYIGAAKLFLKTSMSSSYSNSKAWGPTTASARATFVWCISTMEPLFPPQENMQCSLSGHSTRESKTLHFLPLPYPIFLPLL